MARITLKPINEMLVFFFSFSSKSHPRRQSHAALLARSRKVIFLITSLQRLMEKMLPGHDNVHGNQGLTSLNANQFSSRVVKYRCLVEALHVLSGCLRYARSQGPMQTKSIKVFWYQSFSETLVRIFLLPKGFPVCLNGKGALARCRCLIRSSISQFGRNCVQNRRASAIAGQ